MIHMVLMHDNKEVVGALSLMKDRTPAQTISLIANLEHIVQLIKDGKK
jgi:hypothetical protein